MNDKIIRRLVVLFVVIATVLVGVAIVAIRNINRAVAASDWVNHTHATILELGGVRTAFHASDAALRTLALSGHEQDEAACREALAQLAESLEVVKALTRGDPDQAQQVARLEQLATTRTALTRDVLAARKAGQPDNMRPLLSADTAGGSVAEVRRIVEKLKSDQMALLAQRDREAYHQAQTTSWTVWAGVALNFALLGVTAWLVRDDIAARRRAAAALAEANAQLDEKVKVRTAELSAANEQLAAENLERRWGAQALEHQLRYNELIVNSISDLVFVLTKAQNISRINPAVVQLTGFESTQIINRPWPSLVQPAGAELGTADPDPVATALKLGRDLRDAPGVLTDSRHHAIPVRFTLFPLRDRDKVVGGVIILRVASSAV